MNRMNNAQYDHIESVTRTPSGNKFFYACNRSLIDGVWNWNGFIEVDDKRINVSNGGFRHYAWLAKAKRMAIKEMIKSVNKNIKM